MSPSSELRTICSRLSSTPTVELPHLTPLLTQYILRCQNSLSSNTSKAQDSNNSVLIHKLRTQLSTNLNGRLPEGRFAAVVLIKALLETGEWEVLKISEPWIRSLITIIGRPDPIVTKELCIVTLTKFYLLAHQHQTIVREISTPTLPIFITSCLNILSSKLGGKARNISYSLRENIFCSFSLLLPRHSSTFRPFTSQIRLCLNNYLKPTTEIPYIPSSLQQGARRLFINLFQTAPKGLGGHEWNKGLEELIKHIHVSADQVFRGIDENWESTVKLNGGPTNSSNKLQTSGETTDNSSNNTYDDSIYHLIGLIEFLVEYFHNETPGSVTVPLGTIIDLVKRFLSLEVPPAPESSTNKREIEALKSGVGRNELNALRSRIPQIYIAIIQLLCALSDRLQGKFISLASECFDYIVWIFPNCQHIPEFKLASFEILSRILLRIGKGLNRAQLVKLSIIIKSCCKELYCDRAADISNKEISFELDKLSSSTSSRFEPSPDAFSHIIPTKHKLPIVAYKMLPLFVSHISQQHLHISTRAFIERAAIFSKNKEAMLACVLHPFTGHRNIAMTSILPLLSRQFCTDDVVEYLLHPRMPFLPFATPSSSDNNYEVDTEEKIRSEYCPINAPETLNSENSVSQLLPKFIETSTEIVHDQPNQELRPTFEMCKYLTPNNVPEADPSRHHQTQENSYITTNPNEGDIQMSEMSDDGSVHLTMQMDTDSDSDLP